MINNLFRSASTKPFPVLMKGAASAVLAVIFSAGAMAQSNDKEIDICTKNTSSSYATFSTATNVPAGSTLTVKTARYTDFSPVLRGAGNLMIYSGGERTYLGNHSDKSYPDWTGFTGNVEVFPYKAVESGAGFYGIIMNTNGKSFSAEDANPGNKINGMLANNNVVLHNGATIATEKSAAGVRIGELTMEEGSQMMGYYKSQSSNSTAFYLLGSKGTDMTLAGQIHSAGNDTKQTVGIIKEGKGVLTISGNDNQITGSLRVKEGTVLICNDAATAKSKKKSGATGAMADATMPVAYVFTNGTLGGNGNVGGNVDLYGTVRPGVDGQGVLTLANYSTSKACNLVMHPGSAVNCNIKNVENYGSLDISGQIIKNSIKEDFSESSAAAQVVISLDENHDVKEGDTFTLITAKKGRENAGVWFLKIVLPEKLTWSVNEINGDDGSYTLSVTCTSLSDGGNQNENGDEDDEGDGDEDDKGDEEEGDLSSVPDGLFLRQYLEMMEGTDKQIGVAVPSSWTYNVPDNPLSKVGLAISHNFNLCVAENEMKMDAMEPSENTFNFTPANALATFAVRNKMSLRGHTLVWHQQVPEWISSDGKKNDKGWTREQLLSIMENHITKIVKRYNNSRLPVMEWDVVNETLDDDQSIVRTNPNGYKLRQESVWVKVIGEDFIDSAFVYAHRANPDAKLYLNDYGVEYNGSAKTTALYNLAKRLKDSGIPIAGVGLQCHLSAGDFNKSALDATIKKYARIGLNCILTEIDLAIYSTSNADLQKQKQSYKEIAEVFLRNENCPHMIVWGINDQYSWISDRNPLLFNWNTDPKPAYYGVQEALRSYVATGIEGVENDEESEVIGTEYFSLDGRKMTAPNGICIERKTMRNGNVKSRKMSSY